MLEKILTVLGLAIAIGGFVHVLTPSPRRTRIALLTVCVALAALSGWLAIDHWRERSRVDATKEQIMQLVAGNNPRTFDQILDGLYYPDYAAAEQALDELVAEHLISQRKLTVTSKESGNEFVVRVYNYSPFPVR